VPAERNLKKFRLLDFEDSQFVTRPSANYVSSNFLLAGCHVQLAILETIPAIV